MHSRDRVMTVLNHQEPDRVPLFDSFWVEFAEKWYQEKGLGKEVQIGAYYGVDIKIAIGDETPWPSSSETLEETGTYTIVRNNWGQVVKKVPHGWFSEVLEVPIKEKRDLDPCAFESPYADFRYENYTKNVQRWKQDFCVFCKTGGPYLRTSNLRGTEQFLIDIMEDPPFVEAMVERVTDHLIAVGLEELRRGDLYDTGLWIYDDLAYNDGPMMSPQAYERLFYPAMKRMCEAFRGAGAAKILLHCDGNLKPVLDMLIDAGIEGINPVEPKAGLDVVALKEEYEDRLSFVGGMCNAHVLPGDQEGIKQQLLRNLRAAEGGGLVVGSHSIGLDVPVENYDYMVALLREYGTYPLRLDREDINYG